MWFLKLIIGAALIVCILLMAGAMIGLHTLYMRNFRRNAKIEKERIAQERFDADKAHKERFDNDKFDPEQFLKEYSEKEKNKE